MFLSIIFFILGCLIGWFTNHWYSVSLRQPKLIVNGGGGGGNFRGFGYHYVYISLQNELRNLGFPFGKQIIERETATQCTARLLDAANRHVCQLLWYTDNMMLYQIDIKSGGSSNLVIFVRKDDSFPKYFAYLPISNSDFSPKIVNSPSFDSNQNFIVEISYHHGSKQLRIPIKMVANYDGSYSFENSSGGTRF